MYAFSSARRPKLVKFLVPAVAGALLSGCLSMAPSTMVRLARLSPLETDPAQMRFAVALPEAIRIRDGDVTVAFSYLPRKIGPLVDEKYLARVMDDPTVPEELAAERSAGRHIVFVALSGADADDMRKQQKRIRDHKDAGGDGKGSLSVGVTGCRQGELPSGKLTASAWISVSPDEAFLPLYKGIDLAEVTRKAGSDITKMPPCPGDTNPS